MFAVYGAKPFAMVWPGGTRGKEIGTRVPNQFVLVAGSGRRGGGIAVELIILGVNSPYPKKGLATLGYTVAEGGTFIQLEAGFGIYRRLAEEGLLGRLTALALSHLHCDHAADLPAVVLGATAGAGRAEPLPVYLPPDQGERLRAWLTACGFTFIYDYMSVREMSFGAPVDLGGIELRMAPAAHSLPAAIVTLAAGGRRLVYSGDTGDCPAYREALRGADLVLSEAAGLPPELAAAKGHLPAGLLGGLAKEAGVRRLVLTHFMQGAEPETLAAEAAAAFGGEVAIAAEGQKYTV